MNKIKFFSALLMVSFVTVTIQAQVGVNTSSPHPRAAFEVKPYKDSAYAIKFPEVRTAVRTNMVPSPGTGKALMAYDTTLKSFYYWNGTAWVEMDPFTNICLKAGMDPHSAMQRLMQSANLIVFDNNGNVDSVIDAGTQLWMGRPLKVSKYNNGTDINPMYYQDIGGFYKVYSFQAVSPNICPTGWRMADQNDWKRLFDKFGCQNLKAQPPALWGSSACTDGLGSFVGPIYRAGYTPYFNLLLSYLTGDRLALFWIGDMAGLDIVSIGNGTGCCSEANYGILRNAVSSKGVPDYMARIPIRCVKDK